MSLAEHLVASRAFFHIQALVPWNVPEIDSDILQLHFYALCFNTYMEMKRMFLLRYFPSLVPRHSYFDAPRVSYN